MKVPIAKQGGNSNLLSSEVYRELERNAVKKGHFKHTKSEMVKTAAHKVKEASDLIPTDNLDLDLCNLIEGLVQKGLTSQAADLTAKYNIYKQAENSLYNIKSDDVVQFAHRDGTVKLFDTEGGFGEVETQEAAAKKILDIVEKEPKGANADDVRKRARRLIWSIEKRGQGLEINDKEIKIAVRNLNKVIDNKPLAKAIKFSGVGNGIFQEDIVRSVYDELGKPAQSVSQYYTVFNSLSKKYPNLAQSSFSWQAIYGLVSGSPDGAKAQIVDIIRSLGRNDGAIEPYYQGSSQTLENPTGPGMLEINGGRFRNVKIAQNAKSIFITNPNGSLTVGNKNNIGKIATIVSTLFQEFYNSTWDKIKTADSGIQTHANDVLKKFTPISAVDSNGVTDINALKNAFGNYKKIALEDMNSPKTKVASTLAGMRNLGFTLSQYLQKVIDVIDESFKTLYGNVLTEDEKKAFAAPASAAINLLNGMYSKYKGRILENPEGFKALRVKLVNYRNSVSRAATDDDLVDTANASVSPEPFFRTKGEVQAWGVETLNELRELASQFKRDADNKEK